MFTMSLFQLNHVAISCGKRYVAIGCSGDLYLADYVDKHYCRNILIVQITTSCLPVDVAGIIMYVYVNADRNFYFLERLPTTTKI